MIIHCKKKSFFAQWIYFIDRCQVCKSLPCVARGNRHEFGNDAADIETTEAWC